MIRFIIKVFRLTYKAAIDYEAGLINLGVAQDKESKELEIKDHLGEVGEMNTKLTKEIFDKIKKWYWIVDYKTHNNHYIDDILFSGKKPEVPKGCNWRYINCNFGELVQFSNQRWASCGTYRQ